MKLMKEPPSPGKFFRFISYDHFYLAREVLRTNSWYYISSARENGLRRNKISNLRLALAFYMYAAIKDMASNIERKWRQLVAAASETVKKQDSVTGDGTSRLVWKA